jgi:hypothetical protein
MKLSAIAAISLAMALAPTQCDGIRLRKRYGKLRGHLFTFLDHPEVGADNNNSERELRPTATYRNVTGGFRSDWGKDLFAGFRSIVGTARTARDRRLSGCQNDIVRPIRPRTRLSRYLWLGTPDRQRCPIFTLRTVLLFH